MSSAFTAKGEVKPITDLVVGEVVVDTRMYPDGYAVRVRSRKVERWGEEANARGGSVWVEVNAKGKGREVDGEMYLKLGEGVAGKSVPTTISGTVTPASITPSTSVSSSGSSAASTSASASVSASSPTTKKPDEGPEVEDQFLPLVYSVYTMPASPMHSSSLNAEAGATRHLLRISLPTAQYQVSTVHDPLTGETRKAPEKPMWLRALEALDEAEDVGETIPEVETQDTEADLERIVVAKSRKLRGAVVDIEVLALAQDQDKGKDKKRKRMKKVEVNGVEVPIVGEKESLTSLGREELLDDRVNKMPILLRCAPLSFHS